jgi:hypothetical protein
LLKSENCATYFWLTEQFHLSFQEAGERSRRLFETFRPQPDRRAETETIFSIFFRRNPLKKPDSDE